jgi:hypothetical protein
MAVISLCGSVGGNTGIIKCDTARGKPLVMLIGGATFAPSDYATSAAFKAALLAAVQQQTGSSIKLYPFPAFEGAAPNTEANKTATTGYGTTYILSEGRPAYTFDIFTGTNTEKNLRKFNKAIVPVFIFDDLGNVWGKIDASGKFAGINAQIFVTGAGFSDGSALSPVKVNVNFTSASDFFDYAAYVNTDFNTSDLEGLLDATLTEVAAHTSNAYKIGVVIKNASLGNDVNLYDTYGDALADSTLWYAKNATTGATIAITTVAKDTTLEAWTVTLDSTIFAALSANAPIKIGLVAPAALAVAGKDVTGIEGLPILVKK